MGNEHTNMQLREFIEKAIRDAKNPDERTKLKKKRQERAKKVAKQYAL